MRLKDRVAIVSGGGRNIGRAIAYRLFEEGCHVVVLSRTQKEIDHTAGVIQEQGGRSVAICCDVSKEEDVAKAIEATLDLFGRIDFLVNNAGAYVSKTVTETTDADFTEAVDSNLRGAFLLSRAVLPEFKRQGAGRIINIGSLFGVIPGSNVAIYSMVKAGLVGFTRALARELHHEGISCNIVQPGTVDTSESVELEETRRTLGDHLLPRDIADAVAFLMMEGSSQITGAVIDIPGSTGFKVAKISDRG